MGPSQLPSTSTHLPNRVPIHKFKRVTSYYTAFVVRSGLRL